MEDTATCLGCGVPIPAATFERDAGICVPCRAQVLARIQDDGPAAAPIRRAVGKIVIRVYATADGFDRLSVEEKCLYLVANIVALSLDDGLAGVFAQGPVRDIGAGIAPLYAIGVPDAGQMMEKAQRLSLAMPKRFPTSCCLSGCTSAMLQAKSCWTRWRSAAASAIREPSLLQ